MSDDGGQRQDLTVEFTREAVHLVTEYGYAVVEAARNFGLNPHMLQRWKRELTEHEYAAFPGNDHELSAQAELRQLKEENKRLRMERNFLKKPRASLPANREERCLYPPAPGDPADCGLVGGVGCQSQRLLCVCLSASCPPDRLRRSGPIGAGENDSGGDGSK